MPPSNMLLSSTLPARSPTAARTGGVGGAPEDAANTEEARDEEPAKPDEAATVVPAAPEAVDDPKEERVLEPVHGKVEDEAGEETVEEP